MGHEWVAIVLDGPGSDRANIPLPTNVVQLPLPRYSPELNPAELVIRVLRPKLSTRTFATAAEPELELTSHLRPYWDETALVRTLTRYPWSIDALSTPPHAT